MRDGHKTVDNHSSLYCCGCHLYSIPLCGNMESNRPKNKNLTRKTYMKYKGTLIVVKDCNRALKFYRDMFGF